MAGLFEETKGAATGVPGNRTELSAAGDYGSRAIFSDMYNAFLEEFGKGRQMVLSTSLQDHVTSRMMSIVQREGIFYFQTDREMRKYAQLSGNPQVALCIENIQIEGLCRQIGNPTEDRDFCILYEECFPGSFHRYSALEKECLFAVTPSRIERWLYLDGKPFLEEMDVERQIYVRREYSCS